MPYKNKEDLLACRQRTYLKHREGPRYRNADGTWKQNQTKEQRHATYVKYWAKHGPAVKEKIRQRRIAQKKIGNCEICGEHKNLCYDHNHQTNAFRGWLCSSCNLAIGHFFEDTNRMMRAIDYIKKHNEK